MHIVGPDLKDCTAPTIEEFCEEQAKRIAELEADAKRGEQCIGHLRELAHAHGWNGVENSKILHVFLADLVAELEQDKARLLDIAESAYSCPEWMQGFRTPERECRHRRRKE